MQHVHSIKRSFGPQAHAYLTSTVHAQGEDLAWLAGSVAPLTDAVVLDLGCGAGHASFAVASVANKVVAYDITQSMLDVVTSAARTQNLDKIYTQQGTVEHLPFEDASFDCVISRYSAHHWVDVRLALKEVRRVLKQGGKVCFVDVVGGPQPLLDTHLQAVELLRDPSHVRNYTEQEWLGLFEAACLPALVTHRWRLPIEFGSWISRIGTPQKRVDAITALWADAPNEVQSYYNLQRDLSFELDVAMFEVES